MSTKSLGLIGLIIGIALYAYGCAAGGGGGGAPDADPVANDDGEFPTDLPEPEGELPVGRSSQTLEAAEEKTFRLPVERGETLIVSTNLPDSATNVDLYAYAPNRDRPVASSNTDPGEPGDLMFVAAETATYVIEVVNISPSQSAELSLNVRRIPPRSVSSTVLNGIYSVTERDGVPVSTSDEGWVFSDGELVSLYGSFRSSQFQGVEGTDTMPDWRYWLEAVDDEEARADLGVGVFTMRIVHIQVEQDGSQLAVDIEYSYTGTQSAAQTAGGKTVLQEQTAAEVEQTYRFTGAVIEEGRAIRGDFTVVTTGIDALGEPIGIDEAGAMKLEKDAGDVVVVPPAPVDMGDGLLGVEGEGEDNLVQSDADGGDDAEGDATNENLAGPEDSSDDGGGGTGGD